MPTLSAAAGPLESRQVLLLEAPDRRAGRLLNLEGELVLFRTVTPVRAEFDLTADPGERAEPLGDMRLLLQKVETSGDECTVRVRVENLPAAALSDRRESLQRAAPALLAQSGARMRTGSFSSMNGITPQGVLFVDQRLTFRGLKEPPAKLVYEAVLRSDPGRRIPFQLAEVPLPVEASVNPTLPRDRPSARPLPSSRRDATVEGIPPVRVTGRLAAAAGGVLAAEVRGIPARAGRIAFGLSREEPDGWSAVRWIEARTGPSGIARLVGLRPGRYRIRRTFTPAGATSPLPGPWQNAEVVVTVAAGKEVLLPPLQRATSP